MSTASLTLQDDIDRSPTPVSLLEDDSDERYAFKLALESFKAKAKKVKKLYDNRQERADKRIADLESQIKTLTKDNQSLNRDILYVHKELTDDNARLIRNINRVKGQRNELAQKLEDADRKISDLEARLAYDNHRPTKRQRQF